MGGYGATRIGMKHPEVFGSLYIMSPCCLSAREPGANGAELEKAVASMTAPTDSATLPFFLRAQLATAAAWSPDPKNPPLFLDLPTKAGVPSRRFLRNGQPMRRWTLSTSTSATYANIAPSPWKWAIRTDYGSTPASARCSGQVRIANSFEVYSGTHTSAVADRFQNHLMRFFSESLCFKADCH